MTGEDPTISDAKKNFASIANAALGADDKGKDPKVFEADLLLRRLTRVEAKEKIRAALQALDKQFADDNLVTDALVVEPGHRLIDLARGLANSSAGLRSLLAPAMNALAEMTKAARAATAAARAKATAEAKAKAAATPPKPDVGQ